MVVKPPRGGGAGGKYNIKNMELKEEKQTLNPFDYTRGSCELFKGIMQTR